MNTLEYKGQRVITTAMLAQVYETNKKRISQNYLSNKKRFIEGVHLFTLQGEELKSFKNLSAFSGLVEKQAPHLYLWTERGANRHSKILDTDRAWEQFENLEETYFRVKQTEKELQAPDFRFLNGFANLLNTITKTMRAQRHTPEKIAEAVQLLCVTYQLPLPQGFVRPTYEQFQFLDDDMKLFLSQDEPEK